MATFVSAIIIAAGESVRMGFPKPLLSWEGLPLIQYQISSLITAGINQVVVVLGHQHELIAPYVDSSLVDLVINHQYKSGKTTSIKAGLDAVVDAATDIALISIDQPRPPEITAAIIREHSTVGALITSPIHEGKNGHPLIFSAKLKESLKSISEDAQGIREVFKTHRSDIHRHEIGSSIITLDINDPESYRKAKAHYSKNR